MTPRHHVVSPPCHVAGQIAGNAATAAAQTGHPRRMSPVPTLRMVRTPSVVAVPTLLRVLLHDLLHTYADDDAADQEHAGPVDSCD